jgi:hypothetical protein
VNTRPIGYTPIDSNMVYGDLNLMSTRDEAPGASLSDECEVKGSTGSQTRWHVGTEAPALSCDVSATQTHDRALRAEGI